MTYRRSVVAGWSRRDWLAVAIVAATAAFVAGATLMLFATSAAIYEETARFDSDTTVHYHEGAVDAAGIALPVAEARSAAGGEIVVVGVPENAPRVVPGASLPWMQATLPDLPPAGTLAGPDDAPTPLTLRGTAGTVERDVVTADRGTVLPPAWYVADAGTVEAIGQTGTLVVRPHPGERSPPPEGVVVSSAVPFLLSGARDVLATLSLVALAGGVLSGVAVYSVTRISVLERMRTFFVIRATGGRPLRLLGLVALRGGLLSLVGVAAGGTLGVLAVKGVAAAAAATGYPSSVEPALTPHTVVVLAAMVGMLPVVGTVAGLLAGLEAVAEPPARLPFLEDGAVGTSTATASGGAVGAVTPSLLGWRALAPTTVSLTVFLVAFLVATSAGAAFAPMTADDGGAVADDEAPHLLASRVDAGTADGLRARGVAASPEILLTQVRDGQAYLARGVDYDAFAEVSDVTLVAGRRPRAADEAVIGADLAETLDVSVGETVTLGGATAPGVRRVRVVGAFSGEGFVDDQLLVSLEAARHLGAVGEGRVTLVRTGGDVDPSSLNLEGAAADAGTGEPAAPLPVGRTAVALSPRGADATANGSATADGNERASHRETANGTRPAESKKVAPETASVVVAGVDAPRRAVENASVDVTVTLLNVGGSPADHVVDVNGSSASERVRLEPGAETEVAVPVAVGAPGRYVLRVGGHARPFAVLPADALLVESTVERFPTNATVTLAVTAPDGSPVENATVGLRDASPPEPERTVPDWLADRRGRAEPEPTGTSATTDDRGVARLPTPAQAGNYTLLAESGNRSSRPTNVTVAEGVERRLLATLSVGPRAVPVGEAPAATVVLENPWAEPVTCEVVISWGEDETVRTVAVGADGTATVETPLSGLTATGEHPVDATVGGRTAGRSTVAVVDPATAMAEVGEPGAFVAGSPVSRSLSHVLGDLKLLQLTLVLLAAGMVTGSTATAIGGAVHAARRTVGVHRATGATPRQVLFRVLREAAVLGAAATLVSLPLAFGAVVALARFGYLTLFGIRLSVSVSPTLVIGATVSSIALALLSAEFAAVGLVFPGPARLLSGPTGAPFGLRCLAPRSIGGGSDE